MTGKSTRMNFAERVAAHWRNDSLDHFSSGKLRSQIRLNCLALAMVWISSLLVCCALWLDHRQGTSISLHRWLIPFLPLPFIHFSVALFFGGYQRRLSSTQPCPSRHLHLWTWANLLFSPPVVERVFLPLLSDLEMESSTAPGQQDSGASRRFDCAAGWIFWRTVGVQLTLGLVHRLADPRKRKSR